MNKVFKEDLEAIIAENIPWEKLERKTVLITGASGMIGTYMLHVLTDTCYAQECIEAAV